MTVEVARKDYIAARLITDVYKAELRDAKRVLEAAETDLVDALLEEEMTQIKMESGLTLFLRKQFKITVTQKNKASVREWLLESTGDDQPFVTEEIDKDAVEEHCKTLDKDEIPDFLNLWTKPAIGVRGWNKVKTTETT